MDHAKLTSRILTLAVVNAFALAMLYLAAGSQPPLFG